MTLLRSLAGMLLMFALLQLQIPVRAQEFVPVPPLQTRVTDQAGMLTAAQRATLENVLKDYESRTGSQIAVLLVNKTEPEAIEQYGIRVFDAWQLGRKGVDDGVLLLVAKDNPPALRRLRIEAGRGVQGSLTDAQSKRILQDVIAPHFRQNDFYGGLAAGISAITSLLDKESFPGPASRDDIEEQASDGISLGMFIFFVVLFLLLSRMSSSRRHVRYRDGWGRSSPGIILGGGLGGFGGGYGGGSGGGFGGGFGGSGGFSGGGGTADGGGASGNW
ncbi:TPM domain-containing protein [Noviherbaspirillum aerium]|uniref:TPM domain-containing protein n=1 Tax=Noviherbaspirillum aerium TaxID=2588497 RepID=UPI00124CD302|nr:YgcG family protein [Noviherbaspirillum aerium]